MLRLIGYICLAFMAFQAYVVLYIRSHTDDQYGWKPSLCESAPFVRDVCRTTVELGVYFGVLPQDRAFMSDTTDARDFVAQIKKQSVASAAAAGAAATASARFAALISVAVTLRSLSSVERATATRFAMSDTGADV